MRVNKISTLVLKPFLYSDSLLKLTEIQCGCCRICNQKLHCNKMIKRLLMQDLLYEMPDTKTQKTPWDKNWERIPQPNAAAQTLGVRGVNY